MKLLPPSALSFLLPQRFLSSAYPCVEYPGPTGCPTELWHWDLWDEGCTYWEFFLFFAEPSIEVFQPSNKEGFGLGLQLKK